MGHDDGIIRCDARVSNRGWISLGLDPPDEDVVICHSKATAFYGFSQRDGTVAPVARCRRHAPLTPVLEITFDEYIIYSVMDS
jgi:hypothetical protein